MSTASTPYADWIRSLPIDDRRKKAYIKIIRDKFIRKYSEFLDNGPYSRTERFMFGLHPFHIEALLYLRYHVFIHRYHRVKRYYHIRNDCDVGMALDRLSVVFHFENWNV